jgi:PPOX class probable F420-dependent enzyme
LAELSEKQRELLLGKNFYTLSTIGKDGSPRSTTIWGDLEGALIAVNSVEGRGWLANVRRDPRVAVAVHAEGNAYDQVSIRGRVVSETSEGALEHIDRLSQKYSGRDYSPRDQERVKVLIAIESARSWGD